MATNNSALINAANNLAKRYGTEVNQSLLNAISDIDSINDRYQLPAEVADDFNDVGTFLLNASYKDSEAIDAAETEYSSALGQKLLRYYNTQLTQQDVMELARFIKNYNDEIDRLYENAFDAKYIRDIIGIDPETLEISENSIAASVAEEVREKYVGGSSSPEDKANAVTEYDEKAIAAITAYILSMLMSDGSSDVISMNPKLAIASYELSDAGYVKTQPFSNHKYPWPQKESITSADMKLAKHEIGYEVDNPFGNGYPRIFLPYASVIDEFYGAYSLNGGSVVIEYGDAKEKAFGITDAGTVIQPISNNSNKQAGYVVCYGNAISEIIADNPDIAPQVIFSTTTSLMNENGEAIADGVKHTFASQSNKGIVEFNQMMSAGDSDSKLYQLVSSGNMQTTLQSYVQPFNACQNRFKALLDVMACSKKIYCQVSASSNSTAGYTLTQLSDMAKMCANSTECELAMKYEKPLYIATQNMPVACDSELYRALKALNGDAEFGVSKFDVGGQPYQLLNFSMAYKEFNPEIASITGEHYNSLLVGYGYANNVSITDSLSTVYDSKISSMAKGNDVMNALIDASSALAYGELRSSSYIVRNSAADDLVGYYSGESIDFGTTESEKDDIREILSIYKKRRDYFYRVLYNKSFIGEDKYRMFVRYFIKYLTIDGYLSSRIDNTTDISRFTLTDCERFMESYGLGELSAQIKSNYFSNATTYARSIISHYNELMANKGSRSVIDTCANLLSTDSQTINVSKYMLAKDISDSSGEMRFVQMDYSEENSAQSIATSFASATDYSEFIKSDPYWNATNLSGARISSRLNSPQPTKYIGVSMSTGLYDQYITTQYSLSLNSFMNEHTSLTDNDDNTGSMLDFTVGSSALPDEFGGTDMRVSQKLALLRILYKYYVRLSECVSELGDSTPSVEKTGALAKRYIGINSTPPTLSELFGKPAFANASKDLINLVLFKYSDDNVWQAVTMPGNSNSEFYMISSDGHPDDVTTRYQILPGVDANDINTSSALPSNHDLAYAMPIQRNVNAQTKYTSFDNLHVEYHVGNTSLSQHVNNSAIYACAMPAINSALEAASIISLLAKYDDSGDAPSKEAMIKALYYFHKYGNLATASSGYSSTDDYSITSDLGTASYHEYLYSKVMNFAMAYCAGEYSDNAGIGYDKDVKGILDAVYENYFTSPNACDMGISYLPANVSDDKQLQSDTLVIGIDKTTDCAALFGDGVYDNGFIGYAVEDGVIKRNGSVVTLSDVNELRESLLTKVGILANHINDILCVYSDQTLSINASDDESKQFDFVKTAINYFISYTSYLYSAEATHKYDTESERIRFASNISDRIENELADYAYYDFDITIDELEY